MSVILITGATGNVGSAVLDHLRAVEHDFKILAGVRDVEKDSFQLPSGVEAVHFDLEDQSSINAALGKTDILFLLRPPQLADVKKYFEPVISMAVEHHVQHIVFLSVQGAETSSLIPHHKIEKLITDSSLPYTFLRPAYFMQNFTTTLREDIVKNNQVFLAAGKTKFTVIDLDDVGRTAAQILMNTDDHVNKAYALTNDEQLTFGQMTAIIGEVIGEKVTYISPNLIRFLLRKRKEDLPIMYIMVMIMLHYLPRFQSTPETTSWVEQITGKKPHTFKAFIERNQDLLRAH